jgi:hypothetical protein
MMLQSCHPKVHNVIDFVELAECWRVDDALERFFRGANM